MSATDSAAHSAESALVHPVAPVVAGACRSDLKICLVRPALLSATTAITVDVLAPLGLSYVAAHLRAVGFDVSVVDAIGEEVGTLTPLEDIPNGLLVGLPYTETAARIPADTDVIGVSCMYSVNWVVNRRAIQAIRRRFPAATIVIGGEHATAMPEYCLSDAPEIDYVVLGEGEHTMAALVRALADGIDPARVPGVACLRDGAFHIAEGAAREKDLDVFPWPAWDLLPTANYLHGPVAVALGRAKYMPIVASRGCPYDCTFCSSPIMWGRLWRARTAKDVVDEIESYVRTYQIDTIDFFDLTMITKRSWIVDFCKEMIARDLKVAWEVHCTRSEAIDAEVTKLLKQAGCAHITYAAESGSHQVLKDIRKKVDIEAMLASMSAARAAGLSCKVGFVVGFPDDRLRDVWASYWMAMRAAWRGVQDASFFPYVPYPGSDIFRRLVAQEKITINDRYFFDLAPYSLYHIKSYAHNFSNIMLVALCLSGVALFFSVSFIRYPNRFWNLIVDVVRARAKTQTRLAQVMVTMQKKKRYLKTLAASRSWIGKTSL